MRNLFLFILTLLALAGNAQAQVTPNSLVTAQTPNRGAAQFTNATSAATFYTAYTAGTNGTKISAIFVSNSDTATHVITCGRFNGGTQYESWSVTTVAATAGSYNNAAFLTTWVGLPIDAQGNPYMYLVSGDTIQCKYATTVTSPYLVNVAVTGADF